MQAAPSPTPASAASRRSTLLDAAGGVFARYGYRKASMDEVARAAGVSRQGLYLQFANKEELFKESLVRWLSKQLQAAASALSQPGASLESRLVAACDAWCGRFVGALGSDAADLMCASTSLAGATLALYEARFELALTQAIAGSPLADFCTAAGLSAADLAAALHATARGLKQSSASRHAFAEGMTVTARMFCAPLHQRI
ncbi:MAG: TetR/AcrR family transcriptional regulator [Pseudomonadota bacterium]|nr:TetR/AcrR family transcriptional regulator [Pseudomonadota bacterium]